MSDREPPKAAESMQNSLANRETVAPSGLEDSTPTGSGPFTALPSQFGRYRVTKLLGYGAMGTVYLAFDPELNREVALKIPKADLAKDPALWERFQREARAAGDLDFPSICGMYEVGQIDGTHYISMQYIDGRPLSEFVSDNQAPRKVAGVVRKLALGLAHAHERGIVHRDLKPANVMIDTHGDPVIMDFGLARRLEMGGDVRATQSGMIVGSPAYMSPEQAKAEHDQIGPRTDIYGLGVLFFELLTGSLPFRGPMVVVLGQIATQPPPKPSSLRADVDPRLESLCLKMLEKQPQNRPASMTEVAQTLTDWLKGGGSSPEIALREATSPTESLALTPAKPVASPRTAKADGIEAQKQRVTDLLDKREYSAAIELLDKIVNLRDERFAPLVAWARPQLKAARATEQKLREASAPSCDTAQQLLKHYDYTGAAELLAQVPIAYRSVELRDLLEKVTDLRDECEHLQRDIEEAVRAGDTETLPALVKRLYKLRPNNKAIKQLAADLKEHGAAKVIARRKGQRRFLDPAGRIVEPQHIVWSIVLVVGLFVGVSLMVNDYLKGRKDPVPPPPQPTETDPPKTSPPLPTPIAASELLPQTITSQATGMKLTLIPAGTFTMGSPASELERSAEEGPQHTVRISQPFYMGVHEVTQGEYEQVMGTNPSYFSKRNVGNNNVSGQDTSQFPVELVAWYDAIEFCNSLSAKDGLPAYYTLTNVKRKGQKPNDSITSGIVSVSGGRGYRLPTEAEWEYACRADTTTPVHFGSVLNADKANVNGDFPYGTTTKGKYLKRSTTVGSYPANAFDLYDMHGNVWEWCEDVYDAKVYADRAETTIDPLVKNGSEYRVLRGGSWDNSSEDARSAGRNSGTPEGRSNVSGFRVVFSAAAIRTPGDVTGRGPLLRGPELAAVMNVISKDLHGVDRKKPEGDTTLKYYHELLKSSVEKSPEGPRNWPSADLQQKLEQLPGLKEHLRERPDGGRVALIRLIVRSLGNLAFEEFKPSIPNDQDRLDVFNRLPPEKQAEINKLDPKEGRQVLNRMYFMQRGDNSPERIQELRRQIDQLLNELGLPSIQQPPLGGDGFRPGAGSGE
ncbi:MAG: bifunctional serine/threonine-protein kinase/formylglycine-generating enzyme family protein [Planctomycetota bacterium]